MPEGFDIEAALLGDKRAGGKGVKGSALGEGGGMVRGEDMSSAAVVTGDYDGTVRVFMRKSLLDAAFFAAGPEGSLLWRTSPDI